MKKYFLYGLLILTLFGPVPVWADVPHELAGFVLGGPMNDFKEKVEMDTVIPIRYLESLKEVEAKHIKGFKTGLVAYGTCIEPSRIVRLKFKYADNSKRFFEELLGKIESNDIKITPQSKSTIISDSIATIETVINTAESSRCASHSEGIGA